MIKQFIMLAQTVIEKRFIKHLYNIVFGLFMIFLGYAPFAFFVRVPTSNKFFDLILVQLQDVSIVYLSAIAVIIIINFVYEHKVERRKGRELIPLTIIHAVLLSSSFFYFALRFYNSYMGD